MQRFDLKTLLLLGTAFIAALSGCKRPPGSDSPTPPPIPVTTNATATSAANGASNVFHLPHAQPKLRTLTLYLGRKEINAEIAASRTEISTGMMFRKSMEKDEGMLFVFPMAHQTGFYMKNTTIPLSVAYIDRDGVILEINDLEPLNEEPVESKTDQVQYVLEMNRDWFRNNQIAEGAVLTTKNGSLRQTFFSRTRF